ncbi:hypothetical protein GGI43DRAFT_401523 [Trichoderma evansii]
MKRLKHHLSARPSGGPVSFFGAVCGVPWRGRWQIWLSKRIFDSIRRDLRATWPRPIPGLRFVLYD